MKSVYDSLHLRYRQHRSSYLHGLQTSLLLWALSIVLFLAPVPLRAQFVADTLNILFPLDSIRIDMGFGDNEAHWTAFEQRFRARYAHLPAARLRLDIYSGASPEGVPKHNEWLGEHRGQAVRRLVRSRLGEHIGDIVVHNEGARWEGLYDLIAHSDEPWRDEVLRIIEMPPSRTLEGRDQREFILRRLYRGRLWQKLQKYLAPLRSGASAVLTWQQGGRDTLVIRDTIWVMQQGDCPPRQRDTIWVMTPGGFGLPGAGILAASHADSVRQQEQARRDSILRERLQYPAWALKTNFLLWGVVAPNLQLEIPLGRTNRWSLEVEYFVPWFIWANNSRASQFHNLGVELRRYLGHRERRRWLQGWHIGLAAAVGYYDWEWKQHEGYQGEYINAYLNIGYQHRWGKHWGLDCGIGAGIMATKYRHYFGGSVYPDNHLEEWDEHLIWHDNDRLTWFGPCHANISIVYFFNAWPFHTRAKKLKVKK